MKFFIIFFVSLFSIHALAEKPEWVMVGDMYVHETAVVPEEPGIQGFIEQGVNLWKNGILRYQFSNNLSQRDRQEFLQYCAEMGEFAAIQCLPRRSIDSDYVVVQRTEDNVCGSSYLGRYGGRQPLKIRCWRRRTIQHELMHAFGISHEHNRLDRDDHITVLWDNLNFNSRFSYRKVALSGTWKYLSYYDFDSIMHYGSTSGAKPGKIAFYRTDLGPQSGQMNQTNEMSFGDHYILYALYGGTRPH